MGKGKFVYLKAAILAVLIIVGYNIISTNIKRELDYQYCLKFAPDLEVYDPQYASGSYQPSKNFDQTVYLFGVGDWYIGGVDENGTEFINIYLARCNCLYIYINGELSSVKWDYYKTNEEIPAALFEYYKIMGKPYPGYETTRVVND